jgi:hypothetical protein
MTRTLSGSGRDSRPHVPLGAPNGNRHKAARASAFSVADHARERPIGAPCGVDEAMSDLLAEYGIDD